MNRETKQTALDIFIERLRYLGYLNNENYDTPQVFQEIIQAKEMEKEQIGYSKKDVLKAGELGEINHIDTKHIVSYLDEAKQHNETYGGNK
jgi:hypothetical protein